MGRRSGETRHFAVLLTLVVSVGAVATSLTVHRATSAPPATSNAVVWPADVAPVAHQVEIIRGLRFRDAVPVDYVAPSAGAAPVLGTSSRTAAQATIDPLSAFGLVEGNTDPAAVAGTEFAIAGEYVSPTVGIRIFVPRNTAYAREVLAHELTHALEAQVLSPPSPPRSSTAAFARKAVVEGSASLVEQRYVRKQWKPTLPRVPEGPRVDATVADRLPRSYEYFATLTEAPYALGAPYVDATLRHGELTWDKILAYTPTSDVVIVDPLAAPGSIWQPGGPVVAAREGPTATEVFLLLASRVGAAAALNVIQHAAGSAQSTYNRDGRSCADLTLVTASPDDPTLNTTLDRWVASAGTANASHSSIANSTSTLTGPPRSPTGPPDVQVVPKPGALVLTSCTGASLPPFGSYVVALTQLTARSTAVANARRDGLGEHTTACIAGDIIADESLRSEISHMLTGDTARSADAFPRAYHRAIKTCRSAV